MGESVSPSAPLPLVMTCTHVHTLLCCNMTYTLSTTTLIHIIEHHTGLHTFMVALTSGSDSSDITLLLYPEIVLSLHLYKAFSHVYCRATASKYEQQSSNSFVDGTYSLLPRQLRCLDSTPPR